MVLEKPAGASVICIVLLLYRAALAAWSASWLPRTPECPGTQSKCGCDATGRCLCMSSMRCIDGCVGRMVVLCIACSADFESVMMMFSVSLFFSDSEVSRVYGKKLCRRLDVVA